MHDSAYNFVREFAWRLMPARFILEFGSRNVNGTVRGIFRHHVYWGIDLMPGKGVDQVGNAATYQHPAGSVDVVLCLETLEHTPEIEAIVKNAYRNLSVGGYFVVTCATDPRLPHSAVDGGALRPDEYYRNIAPGDLKSYAVDAGFKVVELLVKQIPDHGGDLYMIARKEV